MAAGFSKLFGARNTQLPSPFSPMTGPSPSRPVDRCEPYIQAPECSGGSNLIPIKGFVHEVLRRSRTSTGVLQAALCYLEAVRAKVPELLRKEKADPTSDRHAEPEAEPRIVQGVFEDVLRDELADRSFTDAPERSAGPTLDTIRVDDTYLANKNGADIPLLSVPAVACSKEPSPPLPPLAPLPSPLCCPRRTFLACLILASKFMQDRSYSNRAWAKLAGLPPREIGRCERAVGEALEWCLWVGKLPSTATTGSESCNSRVFSRTRSDGDLLAASTRTCSSSSTAAWAASATAGMDAQRWTPSQTFANIPTPRATPNTTHTIRHSTTVPAITSDKVSRSLSAPTL
ncbi:G1/S-specific cyclin pas1 [Trametes pubescens]|nr:G1/S-specific cyclin pas1 [Trametes pubescens]OJT09864.1 G1/S-specific cyclin pas1 [Trametes pubescens]